MVMQLNLKLTHVFYFGQPGIDRIPTKDSMKPTTDYGGLEELIYLLKNHNINCPIKYVDVSDKNSADLIKRYDISDSHTWVLEFNNKESEIYENDQPFFKRISEF